MSLQVTRKANGMVILVNKYAASLSNRYKNMSISVKCYTQMQVS